MLTFGAPAALCTDAGGLMGRVLRRYRYWGGLAILFPNRLETQHSEARRAKNSAEPDPIIPSPHG